MTVDRAHFIGVGGAGMSAVAWLLHSAGVTVTGSDAADGPYLRALAQRGLDVRVGHDPALVAGVDAVVVTSALREENVELVASRAAGVAVWHRSEALVRAVDGKRVIAVAGAHGKTTTAAMTAHMLQASGIDATFAIGAPVLGVDGAVGGAYAGTADVAVIEADESDKSFLAYSPEVSIITNVEPDHLDHYETAEAVVAAFGEFAAKAPTLVVCVDDAGAAAIGEDARRAGTTVVYYGADESADVAVARQGIVVSGERYPLEPTQPGWHNNLNAAAAWAAATAVGADALIAASAAATFAGTGRRYELRGTADGVRVIDDYAHHPTEIEALLAAARLDAGDARVVVLFQPHLYSRTRLLAHDFAAALAKPGVDVVIAGIYGAREDPEPGVGPQTITELIPEGQTIHAVDDLRLAAASAAALTQPGDTLLTVGAGSVTAAAGWILELLRTRQAMRG